MEPIISTVTPDFVPCESCLPRMLRLGSPISIYSPVDEKAGISLSIEKTARLRLVRSTLPSPQTSSRVTKD
jgi:hypothetical protein